MMHRYLASEHQHSSNACFSNGAVMHTSILNTRVKIRHPASSYLARESEEKQSCTYNQNMLEGISVQLPA